MKKILPIISIIIFFIILMPTISVSAQTENNLDIYIFTQQGCPYCAKTLSLLETLKNNGHPEIVIHEFDLKKNPNYYTKYFEFATVYDASTDAVPVTFIDKLAIEGFNENAIISKIESCSLPVTNCVNPETYVQEQLPTSNQATTPLENQNKSTVGWVVLVILVIGSGLLIYNKIK